MKRATRVLLRLATALIGLLAVVLVLGGLLWYVWQTTQARGPEEGYEVTVDNLEHDLLGLYLHRLKAGLVATPVDPDDSTPRTFVIEPGQPLIMVAWDLEGRGLITDAEVFRRLVQYNGVDRYIQAGVYQLWPSMTMEEIMAQLQHGRMPTVSVTVPEGWRAEQIAEQLAGLDVVSSQAFLEAVARGRDDYEFLRDRPSESSASLEGFLFPDTYDLPKDAEPKVILDLMLATWDHKVWQKLAQAAQDHEATVYELITLASIVEREAVHDNEREIIAGVFWNRLKKRMPLQADPTVMYAKGYNEETERWWNPMLQEDAISVDSPYNTYLHSGLPPGPICNPGLAAIRAVIEPAETDYLFFVAKGDGSHWFAETYEEHLDYNEMRGE